MRFKSFSPPDRLLPVDEAQQIVLDAVSPVDTEEVALLDASGRILREDITAPRDVPSADNSGMDGYAVRATDVIDASEERPSRLLVIEDVPAGRLPSAEVVMGSAIRIMTGAVVPRGAEAVVPVEQTDGGRERVTIRKGVRPGANIRRAGEDMKQGEVVLRSGMPIRAGEIAVLASVQKPRVSVARRPVVAILTTGDELVEVDEPFREGGVVNSNVWALAALVREAGGDPRVLPPVADTREGTVEAIRNLIGADFIISTGGVSVGAYDFVKDALEELGAEILFWQVAMKPGKPVVFARLGRSLYFGLPGNPVSSVVAFLLFVVPALRKAMATSEGFFQPTVQARLDRRVAGAGKRRTYLRVRVSSGDDGELHASPMASQGSGITSSLVGANGLAILEVGKESAEAGECVPVLLIGPIAAR